MPNSKQTALGFSLRRWFLAALLFTPWLTTTRVQAQQLAVLYPEVREPYRQLFDAIIDGIREGYSGQVRTYELQSDKPDDKLLVWLETQNIDAVLALGGRGASVLSQLPSTMPMAVGGILSKPDNTKWPGVSLLPNPKYLFSQLLRLQPRIKNVYFVYATNTDALMIDQARVAAAASQLNLVEFRVDGVMAMAQQYRAVLSKMRRDQDALWIAHDGKLLDSALLEQLLESAWQEQLLIFSSSLVDVKRGALFTLFPDNHAMGKQLAQLMMRVQQAPGKLSGLEPVDSLQGAINLRTADHLSLTISPSVRQQFTLTFPQAAR